MSRACWSFSAVRARQILTKGCRSARAAYFAAGKSLQERSLRIIAHGLTACCVASAFSLRAMRLRRMLLARLRLLATSRALPRQCLGAGLKRSGPVVASSLAISSSSFWSRALRRSCLPKPHLLRWTMHYLPRGNGGQSGLSSDEPEAIGPTLYPCRASEQRPGPAVP